MAERRPLVIKDGQLEEMPVGDTISTAIAPGTGGSGNSSMIQTEITSTSYALIEDDFAGNVVRKLNNISAITVTVSPSLSNSQPCTFIQSGAGQVTFAPGAGVTISSLDGNLSIAGQYGSVTLVPDETVTDLFYLIGALS